MTIKLKKRILDAWWLLVAVIEGDTITIKVHEAASSEVPEHEQLFHEADEVDFKLTENDSRFVVGATINGVDYRVSNSRHVFDYKSS